MRVSVSQESKPYTLREAVTRASVPRRVWLYYWKSGLAHAEGEVDQLQRLFDEDAISRIRRAERIRRETSGSIESSALIVRLLDRIEKLEQELNFYR